MNLRVWIICFSAAVSLVAQPVDSRAPRTAVRLAGSGPDQLHWERVVTSVSADGRTEVRTNSWTELATGLTYFDEASQAWVPTVEAFELAPNGSAVALKGPHRVVVSPNLRSWGAIGLADANGAAFVSHLLGLAYTDPATGESVLIAEPKDRVGVLALPNRVVWEDALAGVRANVRLTYTRAGVEHDVVLLESPPPPEAFGLPADALLEVWHEVVESPDTAAWLSGSMMRAESGDEKPATEEEQPLAVGSMILGQGRAFALAGQPEPPGLPALQGNGIQVRKSVQRVGERRFLIEAVEYPLIRHELEQLPPAPLPSAESAGVSNPRRSSLVGGVRPTRVFPAAPARKSPTAPFLLARVEVPQRAVVLDYAILNSTANLTIQGDRTYHVSSVVNLTGTTTLESTVLKFSLNAQLRIGGPLKCLTGPYQPAILTAYDDNTAGETLPNSTGNPTSHYATTALYFDAGATNVDVRHVRILHAQQGVYYGWNAGGPHYLRHAQFIHCQTAVLAHSTTVNVGNALMQDVGTAFHSLNASYPATVNVEHLTAANVLTFKGASQLTVNVSNSLLVNVANLGSSTLTACLLNPASPETLFQARAAGAYYLPVGSPACNAGTTAISAWLKDDFRQMTTEAPGLLPAAVSAPLTLSAEVWRDTDLPDLGWHYPALDYLASNVVVSALVTLKGGVAIGLTGSYGFRLMPGGGLTSEGTVPVLNRLVSSQAVQEQPVSMGGDTLFENSFGASLSLKLRLTGISARPGRLIALLTDPVSTQPFTLLGLRDCEVRRGSFGFWPNGTSSVTVGFTNNLLDRCDLGVYHTYYSQNTPLTVNWYNNLHLGGALRLTYDSGSSNPSWAVRDNLFDQTTQVISGNRLSAIGRSHNAYTAGSVNSLGGTPVYTGLNRDFQSGPLGLWYLPATAAAPSLGNLLDGGSRTVAAAGLTHYTVAAAQGKDSGTVAVGYHYPALDPAQLAIGVLAASDVDGDGLPDYQEDVNGNGIIDSGETFFTTADSDADGLSDGCEVAVGTNPSNPMTNGTTPDAQRTDLPRAVYMSMTHALRVEAASGESGNLVRVNSYAVVPQGTDAVWVQVAIDTAHTSSDYSSCNDKLTYKLKIPGIIERSASFQISELGQDAGRIIVDTGWTQCHAQCLSSAPYAEFHLTAQNVNWEGAGASSKVIVRLGAMRVDMVAPDPAVNHRLMFTPAPTGTLDLHMGAVVVPDEARGWVDSHGGLRFSITDIEGSTKSWMFGGSNGEAVYGSDTGRYESEVRFTGLPPKNSAFGPKTVSLYADGLWGLDSQVGIRAFFPTEGRNHPGTGSLVTPNWFYYWADTSAGFGNPVYVPLGSVPPSIGYDDIAWATWDTSSRSYRAYLWDNSIAESSPPIGPQKGQKHKGIDTYAYASRHEARHVANDSGWWPKGPDDGTHGAGMWPADPVDADRDYLPDTVEMDLPHMGGDPPYSPNKQDTNGDRYEDGEDYTHLTQERWEPPLKAKGSDWSDPGQQTQ